MRERRGKCRILVGNPLGKRPLGIPRLDGRILFKGIFKKCDWEYRLD
jgi:hypothetical protein